MSTEDKPGVDWKLIERRFKAGESARQISLDSGISHVSILKRAKRRGWKPVNPDWPAETRTMETARILASPQTNGERKIAAYGRRTPQNAAKVLEALREGSTQDIAALACGIGASTLSVWISEDQDFAEQVRLAKGEALTERVQGIVSAGRRGDWRADAHYLAKHPDSRGEWGDHASSGPTLAVTFAFGRSPEPPMQGSATVIEGELVDNRGDSAK